MRLDNFALITHKINLIFSTRHKMKYALAMKSIF